MHHGIVRTRQRTMTGRSFRGQHDASGNLFGRLNLERSEEHTSDSSHLVISYAVFCLKKKRRQRKLSVTQILDRPSSLCCEDLYPCLRSCSYLHGPACLLHRDQRSLYSRDSIL